MQVILKLNYDIATLIDEENADHNEGLMLLPGAAESRGTKRNI